MLRVLTIYNIIYCEGVVRSCNIYFIIAVPVRIYIRFVIIATLLYKHIIYILYYVMLSRTFGVLSSKLISYCACEEGFRRMATARILWNIGYSDIIQYNLTLGGREWMRHFSLTECIFYNMLACRQWITT